MKVYTVDDVRDFFAQSDELDHLVLRPLAHIAPHWDAQWDPVARRYEAEPESFADDLNAVIEFVSACPPPARYHDHEDKLGGHVIRDLGWPIQKKGARWAGADYGAILEQGGFRDFDQHNLISAASGRVHAALRYGQKHIHDMDDGHRTMLGALLTIIIYHRYSAGTSLLYMEGQIDEV